MTTDRAYELCVRPGDVCIDIGANTGRTAFVFSKLVGPQGKCISFECHPMMFAGLSAVAAKFGGGNIYPYCRALSDMRGHVIMYGGNGAASSEASTIVPDLANHGRLGDTIFELRVEADTLDHFCEDHGLAPQVIKVDVEGAEVQVFAGALETIRQNIPHIVFEFGYGFANGGLPSHFPALTALGYRFFLIDVMYSHQRIAVLSVGPNVLAEVTPDDIAPTGLSGNILALHQSKRAAVLSRATVIPFAEAASYLVLK